MVDQQLAPDAVPRWRDQGLLWRDGRSRLELEQGPDVVFGGLRWTIGRFRGVRSGESRDRRGCGDCGFALRVHGDETSARTALSTIAAHQSAQRGLMVADLVAVLMLPAMLYLMRLARKVRLASLFRAACSRSPAGSLASSGWVRVT